MLFMYMILRRSQQSLQRRDVCDDVRDGVCDSVLLQVCTQSYMPKCSEVLFAISSQISQNCDVIEQFDK